MVVSFKDIENHLKNIYKNPNTLKRYMKVLYELKNACDCKKYRTINFLYRTEDIINYYKEKYENEIVQKGKLGYIMGILKHTEDIVSKSNKSKNKRAYKKYDKRVKQINIDNKVFDKK